MQDSTAEENEVIRYNVKTQVARKYIPFWAYFWCLGLRNPNQIPASDSTTCSHIFRANWPAKDSARSQCSRWSDAESRRYWTRGRYCWIHPERWRCPAPLSTLGKHRQKWWRVKVFGFDVCLSLWPRRDSLTKIADFTGWNLKKRKAHPFPVYLHPKETRYSCPKTNCNNVE